MQHSTGTIRRCAFEHVADAIRDVFGIGKDGGEFLPSFRNASNDASCFGQNVVQGEHRAERAIDSGNKMSVHMLPASKSMPDQIVSVCSRRRCSPAACQEFSLCGSCGPDAISGASQLAVRRLCTSFRWALHLTSLHVGSCSLSW